MRPKLLCVSFNPAPEALNCTASIAADSIVDAISFITGVLFCDQKTSFSQIRYNFYYTMMMSDY